MQYHAIPCNIMQYHAIPWNTIQYNAILCNTMQYHAIPCIINNCWRSVPLPCGQYNGHFLTQTQRKCQKMQGCDVKVSYRPVLGESLKSSTSSARPSIFPLFDASHFLVSSLFFHVPSLSTWIGDNSLMPLSQVFSLTEETSRKCIFFLLLWKLQLCPR